MELITVNRDTCIRCGMCTQVCPMEILYMQSDGPVYDGKGHCIACGQCVAVCPEAALDHVKAPLDKQTELMKSPVLDATTAEQFLRARRSIRSYKKTPVESEKIRQVLNVARQAPTGGNTQGVAYYVMDDAAVLEKITAAVIAWMEEKIAEKAAFAPYFIGMVRAYRNEGKEVILRGAPCLVVAIVEEKFFSRGRDNTHFSLAYAELYAPSVGLGSCWAGFFEACAISGYRPLLDLLKLPAGKVVTGGIMMGYPRHVYKRLVDRDPLQVTWYQA